MDKNELQKRMEQAIRLTAPGQPIRTALDMIIAGHLGAPVSYTHLTLPTKLEV